MIADVTAFAADTLLWTGALAALVLVLRRPVARWFGPGVAYALWLLPLARLLTPPLLLPRALISPGFAPVASNPVPAAAGADMVVTTATITGEAAFEVPWELLLTTAWLVGAAIFLYARWRDYRAMRARLLADAAEVDRREGVRLVETPAVSAPVAFGVRDKVIALPPRFLISGSLAERALAIEHELAHHRGRDLLANWLAQPLLALHWFNPLAWTAWNAMRRDQEAACDARVLAGRDAAARAAYARVIASFAAGEKLPARNALAAPMACPVLGDKSIIHRLRSLTMTDVSPRRRAAGRWTLAASAALALPLTATVVCAGDAAAQAAEPEPPAAPSAPGTRTVEKRVIIEEHRGAVEGDAGKPAKYERKLEKDGKTVIIRSDKPIDDAELSAKLEKLEKLHKLEKGSKWDVATSDGLDGDKKVVRKFIVRDGDGYEGQALAMVTSRCDEGRALADANASHEERSGSSTRSISRTRIMICGDAGESKAEALAHVRKARDQVASNDTMPAELRDDILRQLDASIARLEKGDH